METMMFRIADHLESLQTSVNEKYSRRSMCVSLNLFLARSLLGPPVPCSEEALQMDRRISDGRRQAPIGHALELLDAHLLAKLRIGHDDQWLPSHVKPAGRQIEPKPFDNIIIGC